MSFHHRTVKERLVALQVGDPEPVRGRCTERALDEIGGPVEPVIAFGSANEHPAPSAALQPMAVHRRPLALPAQVQYVGLNLGDKADEADGGPVIYGSHRRGVGRSRRNRRMIALAAAPFTLSLALTACGTDATTVSAGASTRELDGRQPVDPPTVLSNAEVQYYLPRLSGIARPATARTRDEQVHDARAALESWRAVERALPHDGRTLGERDAAAAMRSAGLNDRSAAPDSATPMVAPILTVLAEVCGAPGAIAVYSSAPYPSTEPIALEGFAELKPQELDGVVSGWTFSGSGAKLRGLAWIPEHNPEILVVAAVSGDCDPRQVRSAIDLEVGR